MVFTPHLDDTEPQSKSSRKREMLELQELGEQLVALPPGRLDKIPLPEDLRLAIADARRFARKHEALRRQMQYIGKLMRSVDSALIREKLSALRDGSASEITRQHRLERLRDDLLTDEKTVEAIALAYPGANIQRLRLLRRNALKEREQQRPPRTYREIFKVLRELEEGQAEPDDAG